MVRATTADSEPFDLTTADGRWRFAQARMRQLLAFALTLTRNLDVAHDAVAHAVAHANDSPCRTEGKLFVWLARLVRNFVVDEARAHGSDRALALLAGVALTVTTDPEEMVSASDEDAWLLREVVAALPRRERRAFDVLAAGGDIRDIASEFGISPKAVETMLWRSRSRCKRKVAAARHGALLPWWLRPRRPKLRLAMLAPAGICLGGLAALPFVAPFTHEGQPLAAVVRGGMFTATARPVPAAPRLSQRPVLSAIDVPALPPATPTGSPTREQNSTTGDEVGTGVGPLPVDLPVQDDPEERAGFDHRSQTDILACIENAPREAARVPGGLPTPCPYPR